MNDVKDIARLFKALSDPTRLRLLEMLSGQEEGGALCAGALAHGVGVSASAVSQHLAVLRAAGLVTDDRRGNFVHYRLARQRLALAGQHMLALGAAGGHNAPCWQPGAESAPGRS